MTSELDRLRAALDEHRAAMLKKVAGLRDDDARRSTVPSGTNLAGLLQHLTFVESKWFVGAVGGGKPTGSRSMTVDPAVTLTTLRAAYKEACAASDRIIASVGDPDAPVMVSGKRHDLRWAILAAIGETARHAGHADIIREQIDGATGR